MNPVANKIKTLLNAGDTTNANWLVALLLGAAGVENYNEITNAEIANLVALGTITPGTIYLVTDAVSSTKQILLIGKSATAFASYGINITDNNRVGTYNTGADTFANTGVSAIVGVQYAVPTTGQTVTSDGSVSMHLNPAGTLATLIVVAPSAPVQGQQFNFYSSHIITALTATGLGITALTAGQYASWEYDATLAAWLRKF